MSAFHAFVRSAPFFLSLSLATGCVLDMEDPAADSPGADAGVQDMALYGLEAFPGRTGEVLTDTFMTVDGPLELEYELIDGQRVLEGDILLPDPMPETVSAAAPEEGGELLGIVGHRWRRGVVPYVIPRNFPAKHRILWAMSHIENRANVKFVRRRKQRDFITFRRGPGCASYIGRVGGRQPIWLGDGCSRGNAVHELLHALGVYHEQSRPNRNDHVIVLWENIQAGRKHNFRRVSKRASRAYSPYDLRSIMHYSSFAFSKNGKATIVKKRPIATIPFQNEMSHRDARALNRMY